MLPQRRRVHGQAGLRHHVGHEPQRAGSSIAAAGICPFTAIAPRDHGSLRHRRMALQRRLDLARLDAEAAQLDLRVGAAEEVEHAVGAPAREVAGAVHPAARRPERIGHEPLRRQARRVPDSPAPARRPPTYSSPATPTGTGCKPESRT